MQRRTVRATATSSDPIEVVWDRVGRATAWKEWGTFTVAELERPSAGDDPDGVGAVRRFGFPVYASIEEVVAFEPPTHLGYTMLKGLPITGYRADVTLAPAAGGGTDVEWVASFRARRTDGWFWALVLRGILGDLARRAAKG